jgi:cytochrome c peroxidase
MRLISLLAALLLAAGCQPAAPYPPIEPAPAAEQPAKPLPQSPFAVWTRPELTGLDLPLVFVSADTDPEVWRHLRPGWSLFPPPPAGMATAHLGPASALNAAVSLAATEPLYAIRIWVPLGLPDPTPLIPRANPPTYLKWRLGERLFHDPGLLPGWGSCASCHLPAQYYRGKEPLLLGGFPINPPGLLNGVYNRRQFWDGRAVTLEEILWHDLKTEKSAAWPAPFRHAWDGVVARLRGQREYRMEFAAAFGVPWPTEDAVSKALATYLRTLLAGGSLYDQAALRTGGKRAVEADDFTPVLDEAALERLGQTGEDCGRVARRLLSGHGLFHGKAGCVRCHAGPTFSDGDYHNIGRGESDSLLNSRRGDETGRFRRVPAGLKETRLIGAFRTPSLRNLPRQQWFFHDGELRTLDQVVRYYSDKLDAHRNEFLDPLLLTEMRQAQRLRLSDEEVRDLVLFLRSLDGVPYSELPPGRVAVPR